MTEMVFAGIQTPSEENTIRKNNIKAKISRAKLWENKKYDSPSTFSYSF